MTRNYRMGKRAEEFERTRGRILRATMLVHDEKGVAPATLAEIATRAGVSQATLSRHFPTYGELVQACGGHVWQEMQPPTPETAAAVFAGLVGRQDRLRRLVEALDAFYSRGAHRLNLAWRDRDLMPQIDGFLRAVEAGVGALVSEALAPDGPSPLTVRVAAALTSFHVWQSLQRQGFGEAETRDVLLQTLVCGLQAVEKR